MPFVRFTCHDGVYNGGETALFTEGDAKRLVARGVGLVCRPDGSALEEAPATEPVTQEPAPVMAPATPAAIAAMEALGIDPNVSLAKPAVPADGQDQPDIETEMPDAPEEPPAA